MKEIIFNNSFSKDISMGAKRQTIRKRKSNFEVGDKLKLLSADGSLFMKVVCKDVLNLKINEEYIILNNIKIEDKDKFAREDGFKNFKEMKEFLINQYCLMPFHGVLITW